MRRFSIIPLGLLAALAASGAHAEIAYLPFSAAPTAAHQVARGLLETESGSAIPADKVMIAQVDLDNEGEPEIVAYALTPFFCDQTGCAPRIFRQDDGMWTNVLADGLVRTAGGPGNFSRVAMTSGNFWGLLVGSLLLEWDGAQYREYQPPPVTQLDDEAFLAACIASPDIVRYVADSDARVAEPLPTFCDCLVGQFENAGLPQSELDLFTKQLADRVPDDAIGTLVGSPEDYLYRVNDYKLGCRIDLTAD
ncbi:MAG: hypothetical protein Q8Q62_02425 [Mesorhizobium sp.]|nr:hypothetical protein [Mesorhizobium sp.]